MYLFSRAAFPTRYDGSKNITFHKTPESFGKAVSSCNGNHKHSKDVTAPSSASASVWTGTQQPSTALAAPM